jgi:hypothetical protein
MQIIAIESYISNFDHNTLGINATVGAIIGEVFASASAYPTPASALIDFRNRVNFIDVNPHLNFHIFLLNTSS